MNADEEEFTPERTPAAGYSLPPPVPEVAQQAKNAKRPSTRRIWHARKPSSTKDPFASLPPLRKIDGYELLGQLPSQPHVLVQIARTVDVQGQVRIVKIRRLSGDATNDPKTRKAGYAEMECAALLKHRNIEAVIEICKIDGQLALVTAWDNGITLADMIAEAAPAAPCAWEEVLELWEQALAGLQCAHGFRRSELEHLAGELTWLRADNGVVHGTLTPNDLHIADTGEVRVVGLGLRELRDVDPTSDAYLRRFVAPEVRAGQVPSPSADIFSVGACMLESLRPGALRSDELASFVETLPGVPFQLKALLQRALAFEPVQRFSTLRELATAVRSVPRQREVPLSRVSELVASYSNVERRRAQLRRGDPTQPGLSGSEPPSSSAHGGIHNAPKPLKKRRDPTLSFGTPSQTPPAPPVPPAPPQEALMADRSDMLEEVLESKRPMARIASIAPSRRVWLKASWFALGLVIGIAAFWFVRSFLSDRAAEGNAGQSSPTSQEPGEASRVVPVVSQPVPDAMATRDALTAAEGDALQREGLQREGLQRDAQVAAMQEEDSAQSDSESVAQPTVAPKTRTRARSRATRTRAKRTRPAERQKAKAAKAEPEPEQEEQPQRKRMNDPGF